MQILAVLRAGFFLLVALPSPEVVKSSMPTCEDRGHLENHPESLGAKPRVGVLQFCLHSISQFSHLTPQTIVKAGKQSAVFPGPEGKEFSELSLS